MTGWICKIIGVYFVKELAIAGQMLIAKLFAGLACILLFIVSVGKFRVLPPVPVYLQFVGGLVCVIFAFTYFNAARWLRTPLNQTLGLVQLGFVSISVGTFGFAVYLHRSSPTGADLSSFLITGSALGFLLGCALFAVNSAWAVIRFIHSQTKAS